MTRPLPSTTSQMVSTLHSAASAANIGAWQQATSYGYVLIDTMYRPHPIWRPFDLIRRWEARRWWDQQIRQTGQQLGVAMMQASLRSFTTNLNRPLDQADFDFHEGNRQKQVSFDIDQQIRLARETAKAQTEGQVMVDEARARANPPPPPPEDPGAVYADTMAKIDAIENDPKLTDEQKRRRVEIAKQQMQYRLQGMRR